MQPAGPLFRSISTDEVACLSPHEIASGGLSLEQRSGDMGEVGHELPVILTFPDEPLHFFSTSRLRHARNGFDLARAGPNPLARHDAPQVFHLLGSKGALRWL